MTRWQRDDVARAAAFPGKPLGRERTRRKSRSSSPSWHAGAPSARRSDTPSGWRSPRRACDKVPSSILPTITLATICRRCRTRRLGTKVSTQLGRRSSKRCKTGSQAALAARDWTRAENGLAALAAAPNGAAAGESLRAELTTAKLEEHYLAVAAPASELELLERVALVYPVDAARDGIEGWVDVEFVVDVAGQPRDFEVIAAEPKGRFEDAALAALAKYRYRPFAQDGRPFARRLRLRIRFALQ